MKSQKSTNKINKVVCGLFNISVFKEYSDSEINIIIKVLSK